KFSICRLTSDTTVNGLHFQCCKMNLIYFGVITLVLSTATELSAEWNYAPNERLKDVLNNKGLASMVEKLTTSYFIDIWKQPFPPATSYINDTLIKAINFTERERFADNGYLMKSLLALSIGLNNVNKVMKAMTGLQNKLSKVETLLRNTRDIQVKTGHVELVQEIYDDIIEYLNLFDEDRNKITFTWYKPVIGQVLNSTYVWLDMYLKMEQSTKKIFRYMKKRIRYLQKVTKTVFKTYDRDVNKIAGDWKSSIYGLSRALEKTYDKALGYDYIYGTNYSAYYEY
ncbi:unnamed protein product, partial [Owenia fusiformis]